MDKHLFFWLDYHSCKTGLQAEWYGFLRYIQIVFKYHNYVCEHNYNLYRGSAVVDNGDPTSCVTFPDCNGYEQNWTECIRGHSFDLLPPTSSNLAGFMCGKKLQS